MYGWVCHQCRVILKPEERKFVAAAAKDLNKTLVVTSGYRGPHRQVAAMHIKFKVGGSYHIYRQAGAARAVYDACTSGIKAGLDKAKVIDRMAAVMQAQEKNGIYLSRHMRATAVAFRTFNLTHAEKLQLERACRKHGATVILDEGHPVHLHVQF